MMSKMIVMKVQRVPVKMMTPTMKRQVAQMKNKMTMKKINEEDESVDNVKDNDGAENMMTDDANN